MNSNASACNLSELVKQLAISLALPNPNPWNHHYSPTPEDVRQATRLLKDSQDEPLCRLKNFLHKHRRLQGASLLRILLRQPGTSYTPLLLWNLSHGKAVTRDCPQQEQPLLLETTIRGCDTQTLKQVRQRRKQLCAALQRTDLSPEALRFLQDEKEYLERYLRANVAPGGAIRGIPTALHKTKRNLNAAFSRLLDEARKDDPVLAEYIAAHLHRGKEFSWKP